LNGEDYIILDFTYDSFVEILVGDFITWRGITYTVKEGPDFRKISGAEYKYSIRFEGPYIGLDEAYFLLDGEADFPLTGKAADFLDLIITNLNRVHGAGTYSAGTVAATEFRDLTFNIESCLNVLQRLCEEYELEYTISPSGVIDLVPSVGNATGLNLEYTEGLYNINRRKVGDKNLITRLYAYGSEKNLEYSYGAKRLKLASPGYLEANVGLFGIREGVKMFDDVYPHFNGSVDSVPEITSIVDAGINFDLNDYLLEGLIAKIVFKTGDLAGMEFEIQSYNHTTHTVVFNEYTDENDLTLPSSTFAPAPGDEFTFVDIKMPQAYIDTVLDVGDLVMISDPELATGGLNFRILELNQSIADPYDYNITIGEHVLISYISKVTTEREKMRETITVADKKMYKEIRRRYLDLEELQGMIFDQDNYFDPDRIRPLSIQTSMLAVGSKSTQMHLNGVVAEPNYGGNANALHLSTGSLTHYSIDEEGPRTWDIAAAYTNSSLVPGTAYYIYVMCFDANDNGAWLVTPSQYDISDGLGTYYFLVGILSSVADDIRGLAWLYGQTTINGGFIKTGRIESLDGQTWIDLDSGQAMLSNAVFRTSIGGDRVEISGQDIKVYDQGDIVFELVQDGYKGGSTIKLYDDYGNYMCITGDGISSNKIPILYPDISFNNDFVLMRGKGLYVEEDVNIDGDLTVGGTYPSDFAIKDKQPPLGAYWRQTKRLNRLPAFKKDERTNITKYIGGLEETCERLLRYMWDQEKRIRKLERK